VPMSPSTTSVSFKEALLTFFFVFLIATVALSYLVPPAVVPASAPATDFSAERAMEHLRVIALRTKRQLSILLALCSARAPDGT
jgi:hypothetical protein